jgi:hypothetical protein
MVQTGIESLKWRVMALDAYFRDMEFQIDTCVDKFCRDKNGEYFQIGDYESALSIKWDNFKIKCCALNGACGQYNRENKTLTIDPDYINDDSTILHEMIHIHEHIIDTFIIFHDILLLSLYHKLKDKIPNLDEMIYRHANLGDALDIYETGGKHDVLFFLKSLDLDLELGLELCTICGYDRKKIIKSLEVIS